MKNSERRAITAMNAVTAVISALLLWGCNDQHHMSEGDHHDGTNDGHMMMEKNAGYHTEGDGDHGSMDQASESMALTGSIVDGVRVIDITARQFEFDPEKVVVKQGEKVRLQVTSEDVEHGIGIAAYDIDKKLPPNETATVEFAADKPGTHHFHCSVYCGAGHDRMHGELVVLEAE